MCIKKLKFKIGDLVIIRGVHYMLSYSQIKEGSIGIITERLFGFDGEPVNIYFFDYCVLIEGKEYFLFEEELEIYFVPCDACECDPCDCGWGIE